MITLVIIGILIVLLIGIDVWLTYTRIQRVTKASKRLDDIEGSNKDIERFYAEVLKVGTEVGERINHGARITALEQRQNELSSIITDIVSLLRKGTK